MVRVAKPSDPKRLAELKQKIRDKYYLELAISRIANTLTKELMNLKEEP
jgi:hypothetical protein